MKKFITILMSCLLLTATINISFAGDKSLSPSIESKIQKVETEVSVITLNSLSPPTTFFGYFDPGDNKAITDFLTARGKELKVLGWKYPVVKFIDMVDNINSSVHNKVYVIITGANKFDEHWEDCKDKVWTPANLVPYSVTALTDFYYNMGYICVCVFPYTRDGYDGEWHWWQNCITVTADMRYDCPCDTGVNKK